MPGRKLQWRDAADRWRGDEALLGPVSSREDIQSTRQVVRDDDMVGGRVVADTAGSTNHITTKDINQLPAFLQIHLTHSIYNSLHRMMKIRMCVGNPKLTASADVNVLCCHLVSTVEYREFRERCALQPKVASVIWEYIQGRKLKNYDPESH